VNEVLVNLNGYAELVSHTGANSGCQQ